ncbi:MAG: hypothetical protein Q4C42_12155, partial [Clostridia bacterium]|nr:hypothetical protein [Clostridia bacterium]
MKAIFNYFKSRWYITLPATICQMEALKRCHRDGVGGEWFVFALVMILAYVCEMQGKMLLDV